MNSSTRTPVPGRWRQACAALLAGASMAALLVACGGGGDAPAGPAQSFASGPISGLGSIIVNGVRFDDSAARVENDEDDSSHNARELKLGMMVEIQGGSIDDNTARASASLIRFGSELVGPVASIDAAAQTLRVLDQTIEVKSTTVFEEGLAGFGAITVGQVLEIHAQFNASTGRYVATRIEREDGATAFRLRGRIAALDTTAKTFKIGDAVINYAGIAPADLPAAFGNDQRVRVRLQTAKVNNQWVAISVRTGVRKVDDIGDARLRGLVTAFTSPQHFEVQGIVVDATNARFEPNAAAVKLGALVEVRGQASAGTIVATRVKVRDERDDDLQRVELHGLVSALDATAQTFMLRDIKVNYSRVLEWKNGPPADLANDKQVEVKGLWSEDRRVLFAVVIEFE
ncbi:MAG: DUF5666 domain-containing protein [Burkholderiaceae bacterium]|nr:DUF5666 domain-containing protein [Burkholderiaceae bacterium]